MQPKSLKSPPPVVEPDYVLRKHLGLSTINAVYRLPADKDYAVVVLFECQDGVIEPCPARAVVSRELFDGADMRLQMIWGKVNGKMMITQSWSGVTETRNNGFWDDMMTWSVTGRDAQKEFWEGYEVVAHAESRAEIEPRREIPDSANDITRTVGRKRFVGILGVKPFASKAEANAEVYGRR
jgi:hypothetical protein